MLFDLARDREWIKDKYHNTSAPFEPLRRMAYHGHDFDPATGHTDEEIKKGLRELAEKTAALPHPVAKARAVEYVLQHTRIAVDEHDFFVGVYSLNRLITETTVRKWRHEVFDTTLSQEISHMNALNASGVLTMGPDFDHVVPDWESVMSLGIPGLRERAREYRRAHEHRAPLTAEQAAYFDGIEIEYTAIIAFFDRLYRYAAAQSHEKAPHVAACMRALRDGAPQSLYQALQLLFLFFLIAECIDYYQMRSLGNGLDRTLQSFYQRDLESGRCSREEQRAFLAYFMLQFSAIGNYWGHPFYLGGTDEKGESIVGELTYEILDVYDSLDIYSPKIQIKYSDKTPERLARQVLEMIRRGRSLVICCEPAMQRAALRYGATPEEARTLDIRGCFEIGVRANEVSAEAGCINALKLLSLALHNGIDPLTGKKIGVESGEIALLDSFDKVYGAFRAQLTYLIDTCAKIARAYEPYFAQINPSSIYSATVTSSLELARDGYCNGVKFNNSSMLISALGSAVDALMAIRALVFEEKRVTLPRFVEILDNNWQGHGDLRAAALACPHKYGTGDPEADALAAEIAGFFATRVGGLKNGRGGVFKPSVNSAMEFLWQGERTEATPDGRLAFAETSKNASPTPGMDKKGVTALIRSVTAFPHSLFTETCVLDVMLHPSAVAGEEGLAAMKALLDVYMARGGMCIQFNVFDAATLRDAQLAPERYENLQVRVAGWNVLWNNLSKKEQDAYILRAENIQ